MTNFRIIKTLVILTFTLCLFSCKNDNEESKTTFDIFKIIDDQTIEMEGDINSSTLDNFNELIASYPEIDKINIVEVPGSADDEVNLQVSKIVHDRNIAIHLMDNGFIASGGVDFFLAGISRTKGSNTMIGVHSWSDGTNEATDFPDGDSNHEPYIDYYISVGFNQADAEAFYYFTINAAPASDIHYMTEAEIDQYNIIKP